MQRVRRAYSPPQLSGRPLLENVVYPLYSTAGLAAAALPAEINLFQYAKGQAVPGAGNFAGATSSLWHTNMDTPSSLAAPKVFTITGVRCHLSHVSVDSSTANQTELVQTADLASSATENPQLADPLRVFNSGVLRLTVGPKTYCNHPLWFFPSNIGVGGLNSVSTATGSATSTTQRSIVAAHQVGQYFDFDTYPVVIAAQQSFGVNISFTWATNPTLTAARAITVFLDGIMSREVS